MRYVVCAEHEREYVRGGAWIEERPGTYVGNDGVTRTVPERYR
jgi:hypothetical protein